MTTCGISNTVAITLLLNLNSELIDIFQGFILWFLDAKTFLNPEHKIGPLSSEKEMKLDWEGESSGSTKPVAYVSLSYI